MKYACHWRALRKNSACVLERMARCFFQKVRHPRPISSNFQRDTEPALKEFFCSLSSSCLGRHSLFSGLAECRRTYRTPTRKIGKWDCIYWSRLSLGAQSSAANSTRSYRFFLAMQVASLLLLKVGKLSLRVIPIGSGHTLVTGLWAAWAIGYYLLAIFVVTLANTQPVINGLVKSLF